MSPKRKTLNDDEDDIEEKLESLDEFMNDDEEKGTSKTTRVGRRSAPEVPLGLYRKIAVGFIVLTGVLLLVMLIFTASSATIVITPKQEPISASIIRTVGGTSDRIDGVVMTQEIDVSHTYNVAQGRQVDGFATGKIKVTNTTGETMSLIPRTRFESIDGIIFRIAKRIDVPAKGSVTVDVTSDVKGKSGEIAPGKFTLPGLPDALRSVIYGESATAMTGGIRTAGILTDTDVATAETELLTTAKKQKTDELTAKDEAKKFTDKIIDAEFISKKIDKTIGAEVDSFTMTGKVRVTGVFFNSGALDALTRQELFGKVPEGMRLGEPGSIQVAIEKLDATAKTVSLKLTRESTMTIDPTSGILAPRAFTDKSKEEVTSYLKNTGHIDAVEVTVRPRWRSNTPSDESRIKVTLK